MKDSIKVLIVDSGIDENLLVYKNKVRQMSKFLVNEDGVVEEKSDTGYCHLHGTIISNIIQHMCNEVEFISFNILDEELNADYQLLSCALEKAYECNARIVHLSLGTTVNKYKKEITRLIDILVKQNKVIVSAGENNGKISYPAYLNNVIGVKGYDFAGDGNAEVYAQNGFLYAPSMKHKKIAPNEIFDQGFIGNSIAAAYVTGLIARQILDKQYSNKTNFFKYVDKGITINI
jgi:hypothetical protein